MAPLSILPGRIRFENTCLVGKPHTCKYLQKKIVNYTKGVTEVTINHRTGRILIKFDEKQINRQTLSKHINCIMKECDSSEDKGAKNVLSIEEKGSKITFSHIVKHPLVEAVAHAFLPKPLNILVPVAIKGIVGKA
jgi:copper chaperone CopZ